MGSGFKDFAVNEVLTSSDVDEYLMRQSVMSFASAAARDAALGAFLEEGMLTYLQDVDRYNCYTNGAWTEIAYAGAWAAFTPTWSGSGGNPSLGNGTISAAYKVSGKSVEFRINLTWGSTTSAGSGAYGFTLPAAPVNDDACGAVLVDSSATLRWSASGWLTPASGVFRLVPGLNAGSAGVAGTVPFIFATGDQMIIGGTYEKA